MNRATQGIALAATLVLSSSLAVTRAQSQSLGSRIDAVRDGRVRMTFAARPGVCGNDVQNSCEQGPVRVEVRREGGDTKEIRTYVGGRWRG